MPEVTRRLINLLFPAILLVFVALYLLSLTAGNEPELALFRSGGASVLLAVLARLGIRIVESGVLKPEAREVPTLQPATVESDAASSDLAAEANPTSNAVELSDRAQGEKE
jgi:hypothetical protein